MPLDHRHYRCLQFGLGLPGLQLPRRSRLAQGIHRPHQQAPTSNTHNAGRSLDQLESGHCANGQ